MSRLHPKRNHQERWSFEKQYQCQGQQSVQSGRGMNSTSEVPRNLYHAAAILLLYLNYQNVYPQSETAITLPPHSPRTPFPLAQSTAWSVAPLQSKSAPAPHTLVNLFSSCRYGYECGNPSNTRSRAIHTVYSGAEIIYHTSGKIQSGNEHE